MFALHQAGAPELTVIAGNDDDASRIETMVNQTSSSRNVVSRNVRITALPTIKQKDNNNNKTTTIDWWKLFEDDYVTLHGTLPTSQADSLIIYLFTCRKHSTIDTYTIAVLPDPAAK